ncbi:predicted protein [Scheffersomyces stipitis CBS 6054]|uniref:Uncharacterized protein n=1 Tax=Scheffersomyces stipitis (strain ATCC 58785 / CBS 6054 / NBRC 10063 / NRRL Y-11545) TaxID=322104 RepID=A3LZJ2_PICST|nr:predicted protein [Scheffersomyces stipitis CBS 6054]ABN68170.2 predicted protein [Scheffersomyces stipitis CBS 6054]
MAEQELALINKVELRIALASDDSQFESALSLYLAPILLKLASPHAEVRKAILKVIQHLIPRISAARTIKLPVGTLIDQVKNPKVAANTDSASVRLYSLLFISRSVERLNAEERKQLIPQIVAGISTFPSSVSARLFNVLCKLLETWKSPARDTEEFNKMNEFLSFDKSPEDEKFLADKIAKFLMLQPSSATGIPTPGLGQNDVNFFNLESGVVYKTQQEIFNVKTYLLEFLKAGFTESSLAIPLMVASVDNSSAINDSSEILFRKLTLDLEDKAFVDTLVEMFVGSEGIPPVKSTLQERILQVLIKSKIACTNPQISKIANLGLASDYLRLKQITVQFINWISSNNSEFASSEANVLKDFNIAMAAQLRESLLVEGWPQMDMTNVKNYSSSLNQRTLQYEALGRILRTNPELFIQDIAYIEFLFQSLEGETPDLRATIQDALSSLTVHLPQLGEDSKRRLKQLTRGYLLQNKAENTENIHPCRYVSIKYINSAFPFDDSEARYLCILGTAKVNRSDTIEEARRGLHPHWFNILQSSNTLEFKSTSDLLGENSSVSFPTFVDFVATLNREIESSKDKEGALIFQSLARAIKFALQILVMEAVMGVSTVIVPDQEWSVRLDKALEVDKVVQDLVIQKIDDLSHKEIDMDTGVEVDNAFIVYTSICSLAFHGQYFDSTHISPDISYVDIYTKLVSLSPPSVIQKLQPDVKKLLELLDGKVINDHAMAQVCKSLGIIASHPVNSDQEVLNLLEKLAVKDVPVYLIKGRLLSTSYIIGRLYLRQRVAIVTTEFFKTLCEDLLKYIGDTGFYSIVLDSLAQLSIFGVFGPALNSELTGYVFKFLEFIIPKVKKIDEKSVLTLAFLSLSLKRKDIDVDEELSEYEKAVYETHISKQVEYTFTSGEALSVMVTGWQSKFLQRELDIQGEGIKFVPEDISRLPFLLNVVLKACANTKPSLRKAGCIWLLSLVQYCGHLEAVRSKASEIHVTFMRFLADRDELVQESASRGLSIFYEMVDSDLKDTLVRGLLKSFADSDSTAKFTSGTVEHDTELFEPDLLKTNDGSVSTYRDVLSLASDVGDPSLVYKFMSLAKSSALWSSRKGMAFGLGSILSKSSLDNLLASNKNLADKLIPKLYRYKYDPNLSVQKSMNDIWNALVKDTSKTIKDNFETILRELLKSMGNKEWRVRQASTAALNDLLQIVPVEKYESNMEDIWNMSFRVMDDIKETVRKEGNKLTKSLATTLTRMIDAKNGVATQTQATEILESLLPFLLENKGLLSDSEDVRNFALETILKLCKVGGAPIRPFIPKLIENFINLMSTLEPEVINYLILNADKYNIKSNDIDAKRLQSLGSSPMMDAIEKLIDGLDNSLMEDFIVRLESSIKGSVGLPSKVCGSRVLVTLVTKHLELVKPYGDKLLKISSNQVRNKNDTIASSYATATGYLCRIATIPSIISYSKQIKEWYFESEDETFRERASVASESVSKYSGDKFEQVASAFLPLAFIGKYDSNKIVRKTFEREWIENTSGSSTSIKLYLTEILEFFKIYINSNRFEIRKILARSISNLSNSIDNISQFSEEATKELIELLVESNKGKSWEGKELVLESLVSFSIKAESYLKKNAVFLEKLSKVVTTEAKRKNKEYQQHAIKLMGRYIHIYHEDEELVETYIQIMSNVLNDKYFGPNGFRDDDDSDDEDAMDVDLKSKINVKQNVELEERKLSFLKNLFETFYVDSDNKYSSELLFFIFEQTTAIFHSKLIDFTWRSKQQTCEGLNKILLTSKSSLNPKECKEVFSVWKLLGDKCLSLENIENVKVQFIRLSSTLISQFEDVNEVEKVGAIKDELIQYKHQETSTVVQTELSKIV